MAEPSLEQIAQAVEAFMNAQTWEEGKRIIEVERDKLLTDAAEQLLGQLLEQYRNNVNATRILEDRLDLLARCRCDGIERAFAVAEELQMFLSEIDQLSSPSDLSRRVELCRTVLRLVNRDAQAQLWAELQILLANCLAQNPQGERADNLEQAILHYQQALQVRTRQAFPEEWAMTQGSLGNAYSNRMRGERADNLEQAILHFEQALEVFTHQAFPHDWAMTQGSLGNSYGERIRGERADNLEQAILHYEQALQVRSRQAFPEQWARTQNNLGVAYRERIRGERADNLEQAILHYQQALEVFTQQAFPHDWALTQHNLGVAYRERIRGERADNMEQAILHYQQALEVFTQQAFPQDWALTQNNLGVAYGERADNLEQAILHYQQALEVFTQQAFPQDWALTQNNLGVAYGERADNLEQSILHYQQALEVYTPITFPQLCRDSAYLLGRLLYNEHRFSEGRYAFETAHQAVEALRGEVQRNFAKRSLAKENADLYARLVSCCLREGDEAAAFVYAIAGKGRAFVDLLATARLDLSAASANDPALADDLHRVRELRQQIDVLLATMKGESGPSTYGLSSTTGIELPIRTTLPLDVLRTQLSALQAQETRLWEEMAYKYPALTATQKAPILSVDQAHELAAELNATLVEYYRHREGWCAFVVTPTAMYHVPLPLITDYLLEHMVSWMLRLEYPVGRNRLSDLHLSDWYDAVIAPLEVYLPQKQPIVLAPFGLLHVLPMAAARNPQTGRYITEDYLLSFAPSLSALRVLSDQTSRSNRNGQAIPHRLLSVAYPGAPGSDHYLNNVLPEAKVIAKHFTQVTPLYQQEATPEAVLLHSHDQDVVHFGCHGEFDSMQPEQSGLLLAGGWLTVQRIITELRLEQARLATLAACFSGRAALNGGDEHVGLLQAILTTGVQVVVASLWSVADAPTRALFEAFYASLVAGHTPASAMQEAVQSMRAHPGWEHPYYWAAFQVSGLAHGTPKPVQVPFPTT
jgi:CHAT domain-containing protein/tetratricopeptide (TPR) repeat protein